MQKQCRDMDNENKNNTTPRDGADNSWQQDERIDINEDDQYHGDDNYEEDDEAITIGDEDFFFYHGELEEENYLDYFHSEDEYNSYSEYDEEQMPSRRPWPLWQRLVALVTVLAFASLAAITAWPTLRLPLPDVLIKSILTEKDLDVQRLEQAVVKINVVSKPPGAVGVQQKNGTGFNIDPTGIIITNHHVIDNSINLAVTFTDGKIYKAQHWASDATLDLAVISLDRQDLPTVPVNRNLPIAGEKVKIVGNPLGLNNVVVEGKALRYGQIRNHPTPVLIMDAPVYPGNSGSPVFNQAGQVVAVVFASMSQEDQEYPLGLAVPISASFELQQKQTQPPKGQHYINN